MSSANVLINLGTVIEGTTSYIKGTVVDESGTAFKPTTAVYTLYDLKNGVATIIHGRNNTSFLGSVAADGTFALELLPADNVFIDSTRDAEIHLVRMKFTWNTEGRAAIAECGFTLRDDDTPTS